MMLTLSACFESKNATEEVESDPELSPETLASQVAASLAEEETLSLADELRVRPGELALFDFWDALRISDQPMQTLATLPVTEIQLPDAADCTMAQVFNATGDWKSSIGELANAHGYTLGWSHWKHLNFDPQSNPPESVIEVEFHFSSGSRRTRTHMKAELAAAWSITGPATPGASPFTEVTMRVTSIAEGQQPAFYQLQATTIAEAPSLAAPMLIRDLNQDHYPEVILLGSNTLLWNQANCTFVSQPLCGAERANAGTEETPGFRAGAFGEFTGDLLPDLALVDSSGRLSILPGAPAGAFTHELLPVPSAPDVLNVAGIAAADIDGDGDSDLYLAQDKPLFVGGQMPSPTDNATGGNPDYLLRNDGSLQFTDITDASDFNEKRHRRSKDAKFHDHDGDGDPDLFLASAFAPIDVFENRGGQFVDISQSAIDGPPAPLIANNMTFADLDSDGLDDLAVAAVESKAGARIEAIRGQSATSPISSPDGAQSGVISDSSSRMLGNGARRIAAEQSITGSGVLREFQLATKFTDAGWAQDIAFFDYDNDGDLDAYIANGNISGGSTRDFDLYFWQRELHAATALEDPVIALLYTDHFRPEPFQGLNEGHISWQGHQANRFYQNDGTAQAATFRETGFLTGTALLEDSLATEAVDLDLDGHVDLLVITQKWKSVDGTLLPSQSLKVLRNENTGAKNWIGFQFENVPKELPMEHVRVELEFGKQRRIVALKEGSSTLHVGLGNQKPPSRVRIHWMDGITHYIDAPETGRYIKAAYALD